MSCRLKFELFLALYHLVIGMGHCALCANLTLKERIKLDYQMEEFLSKEFDYAQPFEIMNAYTLLPFRDIHEDQFWKELRGYIEKNFTKLFQKLELKPWLPIDDLKNELAKCGVQYKYVSLSQQQFVYDKDIGSFMNLMKFSCVLTEEENIVFGVGLQRFKYRLKEVFLNRQKYFSYWVSATRPITIKDMQKLMEHFTTKFADEAHENFMKEMRKLNIRDEESGSYESEEENETTDFLEATPILSTTEQQEEEFLRQSDFAHDLATRLFNISKDARQSLLNLFPSEDIMVMPHLPKEHTFKYVSIPITIRIILTHNLKVPEILDIFQNDLSDDSKHTMEMCIEQSCEEPDDIVEISSTGGPGFYRFFEDRSLHFKLSPNETLLAYATSSPQFRFDQVKKKKGHKTREIHQELDDETRKLWYDLLESRIAQNFYVHHKPALKYTEWL